MNQKAPRLVLTLDYDDFSREIPFLIAAIVFHGFLLTQNPGLNWGYTEPKIDKPIPVEFVKEIPQSANLAPIPAGNGKKDELFQKGPGPIQVRKIKKGSPVVKKKPALSAEQLAAIKLKKLQAAEAAKARALAAAEAAKVRAMAAAEALKQKKLEKQQRMMAVLLERQRQEQILADRKAAMAKAREEQRQRLLEERQTAMEQRAALQAEQRRAAAQRKLEVEQQLAMLASPEESVTDAGPEGVGETKGAGNSTKNASIHPAVGVVGAGAAGEGPDFEVDGKEGRDAVNQAPMGGGYGGGEGGPVAWSLEGPAGNRRLVKRKVPECPDWVSNRGLDLTVKLRFRVLENGEIKDGVIVKGTSGFPALDQIAIETLKKWKFEAFKASANAKSPEIWGVVSFRFVAG